MGFRHIQDMSTGFGVPTPTLVQLYSSGLAKARDAASRARQAMIRVVEPGAWLHVKHVKFQAERCSAPLPSLMPKYEYSSTEGCGYRYGTGAPPLEYRTRAHWKGKWLEQSERKLRGLPLVKAPAEEEGGTGAEAPYDSGTRPGTLHEALKHPRAMENFNPGVGVLL
ncbi:hypothetical protein C7212DRAFT_340010 [Tuber magnatum]|uniref:Uncharacterized protein n=1 Tax=Tuber magnatum TaxID=42249 RepID=A0A317SXC4_9PEZI|nr:hypothetical protein C7212DRAFT_340010 [Tuber magnatum]